LHGLGLHHWGRGEFGTGLDYCNEALSLTKGRPDRWLSRQKILSSLSLLHGEIGHFGTALKYAQQAVELCQDLRDWKTLPACLNNYACLLYSEREDIQQATDTFNLALEIAQQENDLRQQATIFGNLGLCHLRRSAMRSDLDMAEFYLHEALSISHKIGSLNLQAHAISNMGLFYQATGQVNEATKAFSNAATVYHEIGAMSDEASAYIHLAWHVKNSVGDIDTAYHACKKSVDIIEKIRGGLKREAHRITYAEQAVEPYALMVDCLLRLEQPEEALEYVERSKSRALLDFLSTRLMDRDAIQPDSEEFQRALELLREMDEIKKTLDAMHHKDETDSGAYSERATGYAEGNLFQHLLDEFFDKEKTFEDVYNRLLQLQIHPEKATLLRVATPSLEKIQKNIDNETLLIDLYQTADALLLFVVSREEPVKLVSVAISGSEAQELVWQIVTGIQQNKSADVRSHEFIRTVRQHLSECFERLIAPLGPFLSRYQRLIIAPHLFWHYFPFHALYDRNRMAFLCDTIEIGYCPSAAILQLCLGKNRHGRDRAVILARNDGNLPYADMEAEKLAAAFHPYERLYMGKEAHWGQIQESGTNYDVIHLACHGQFHQEQPFLSGIDIPPGKNDERRTYLLDFFNLNLDCTQVTLSACESGMNVYTSADELIGLSRGIFYAGAAAVLLSMWKVADASTCYLMENYYWHFVKNRQTKTRALQLAMQAVKVKQEYSNPYYWAPFVVMGDWR